jgi:NAD(P)-dependent dehydrogenase (short-subunit alcohol dehydrogenase family)
MFEGKIALVTGATAGMGRATAIAFAREGAKVIMAARRGERGQEVVDQIAAEGGESMFVKTDVRNPADIDNLFKTILARYGRLDFAFNNAGVSTSHNPTVIKYEDDEWDRIIETNLRGVWLCMKASSAIGACHLTALPNTALWAWLKRPHWSTAGTISASTPSARDPS